MNSRTGSKRWQNGGVVAFLLVVVSGFPSQAMASGVERWRPLPMPACGDAPQPATAAPAVVLGWIDAYFVELASAFPESTRRLVSDVYFHGTYVHSVEGLAQKRGVAATAELVNTGTEVFPYVVVDKALVASALVRRAVLLPPLLGVLAVQHAESERLGVTKAYWRSGRSLQAWTRLLTLTLEQRLAAALRNARWNEALAALTDEDVRRVVARRFDTIEAASSLRALAAATRSTRQRPFSVTVLRAFERRLAAEEARHPCRFPSGAAPKEAAEIAVAPVAATDLPIPAQRTALDAPRTR